MIMCTSNYNVKWFLTHNIVDISWSDSAQCGVGLVFVQEVWGRSAGGHNRNVPVASLVGEQCWVN